MNLMHILQNQEIIFAETIVQYCDSKLSEASTIDSYVTFLTNWYNSFIKN